MKFLSRGIMIPAMLATLLTSCGPNEGTDPTASRIGAPQNLKSVSMDRSTVGLNWDRPPGAADSSFAGYTVQYGNHTDTLGKAALQYVADSLLPGESAFIVAVRTRDGATGDGAAIRWAPAERFGTAYTLTEYTPLEPLRLAGLKGGGKTTNPVAVAVNPSAVDNFDLYLYGGGSAPSALPLFFWSASLYTGATFRTTLFSTVTHPSSTLDYYVNAFPAQTSFTLTSVLVMDNTIYYAKIAGDSPSETHYVRILVRGISGGFPARTVQVTLSLQRVPGLLYAAASTRDRSCVPPAMPGTAMLQ